MAQPTEYQRQASFTQWDAQNPGVKPRGSDLDAEFNALKLTTDQVRASLGAIQRDDLRLANGSVYWDTLSPEVQQAIQAGVIPSGSGSSGGSTGGGSTGGGTTTTGGSGVVLFRQLLDVPHSFAGAEGKPLRVNAGGTGLEFYVPDAPTVSFLALTDTPKSYNGAAGQYLRVAEAGGYLEYAALTVKPGETYARTDADTDFGGRAQSGMVLKGYQETVQTLGSVSGVQVLDLTKGNIIRATVAGDCSWALAASAASGKAVPFTLILTNAGAHSHSWPLGTTWATGAAPTLPATGFTVLTFVALSDVVLAFKAS